MKNSGKAYNKLILYIAGLLIMSVGSNLFLKAALGVAPSCTIALALTEIFPSAGYAVFNFIVNICLLLCEIAVEKRVGKKQFIQLVLTLFYSLFIQLTSLPFQNFTLQTLPARICLSFIACAVLAAGISFTVNSGFAALPMEGFVSSLAERKGLSFGTVRVYIEISITLISSLIAVAVLHSLSVIGIGTVIAAICTGQITNWITHLYTRRLR